VKLEEAPYVAALSRAAVGRTAETVDELRELEPKTSTRLREFMVAARTLLQGDAAASVAAVGRILASDFRDPEALFYLTRHLAYLKEVEPALELFRRVVAGGFFCLPAMQHDPWLNPLRRRPAFEKPFGQAREEHDKASTAFAQLQGGTVLGLGSPAKTRVVES
jgi:hypothetical protein